MEWEGGEQSLEIPSASFVDLRTHYRVFCDGTGWQGECMETRAECMAHCVWLWMGDFFGDEHEQLVDVDLLIELLKEGIEYRDEDGLPFEQPWVHVWDEINDECEDGLYNMPAEVMEIVEILCHEDMTLAIEILNHYKHIIAALVPQEVKVSRG
jgi:hypothetical protein